MLWRSLTVDVLLQSHATQMHHHDSNCPADDSVGPSLGGLWLMMLDCFFSQ